MKSGFISAFSYLCSMEIKENESQIKTYHIETYGCQMNVNDSGIVSRVLSDKGLKAVDDAKDADVILLNTCSIRENAEQKIKHRISELNAQKRKGKVAVVGILGCMAERMKDELVSNYGVDIVAGVDSYRNIGDMVMKVWEDESFVVDTDFKPSEMYEQILPQQMKGSGVTAFVSIMRGCDNFCSYCVVPYTRGRERSRNADSIVAECRSLFAEGYKEVTLLGQNVNSYCFEKDGTKIDFADLMLQVAQISPLLRVRFATSHPKDISEKLIGVIASQSNICKAIHLPLQSGSNVVLQRMNRKYTREAYLEKVKLIRDAMPSCSITTDIIVGFCGETEEDFLMTLDMMERVNYDYAFMFQYSERPDTLAQKKFEDDVPANVKNERLSRLIEVQRQLSLASNRRDVGKQYEVLVEGYSHKSAKQMYGRTSQNKVVVFDGDQTAVGSYVTCKIEGCTSATLTGKQL
ncbi:MAG: tRNA (N6-isopentenyl adenosine(37)-C2)-methylthiotransferase MiaB [Bacteroidales bacterium]|jgi:tRNA-2-methylthio-N6-dimethylallyladenosine synthase|nr:tRNA (N6-isopentenyl adenosine(37)-C2)-methylthiotransferase MiaB [Bacteroidales bacterium]